jgi:hypothetical protein
LLTTIFLLSLSSGLTQAATQEAECYGGPFAGEYPYETVLLQGSFRALALDLSTGYPPYGQIDELSWGNFDRGLYEYQPWGECVYRGATPDHIEYKCGDASIVDTQVCWSEDPFTLANTSNGEACASTIPEGGIAAGRDQTLYAISIDRSGAETKYCQIEFKTLATGEEVPDDPRDTGSTRVVGLAGGDPETDQTPDGPTKPWPGFGAVQAAVPFMPHILLIGLTCLLATLGVRRVRRKKVA